MAETILAGAASDELVDIKERGGITTIFAPGARGLSTVRAPFAAPLVTLMAGVALLLCIAQLGPGLVIIPAIIWLFATGQTWPAIVLIVIGVPTVLADNVLRPILIKRGADLPLLLILIGVIGGLLAFGMIGLFVGPVILAVTHTLLEHWIAGDRPDGAPA